MPSVKENWGLVVHEAALCGCALLLSRVVGSAFDFASDKNARLFNPKNQLELEQALLEITSWPLEAWGVAQEESCRLAAGFSPTRFAEAVDKMVFDLLP